MSEINCFGRTDWRGEGRVFGIRRADRRLHMYVIGRTGMGKTTLLLNMALNDLRAGEGICFLDPHGDAVMRLLDHIPDGRGEDVVYFDPADPACALGLNPLEDVPPERRHLVASGIVSVFRRLYPEDWRHRQEHILRNALLTLLEREETSTLLDVHRLLTDWRYRRQVTAEARDPVLRTFWANEFARYQYQSKGEALAPILNKLGGFLTTPLVRNVVDRREGGLEMRRVMDEGRVLLVNLSKGRLGEDSSAFLGSLLIAKLQLAALARADQPEEARRDFYLYVDEFQTFLASDGLDDLLSEARKYRLCLVLAHQYLGQLDERTRLAVWGNVGTVVAFPVGPEDAEELERQFQPYLTRRDLVGQERYHMYVRLAINGVTSRPFSATALPPLYEPKYPGENQGRHPRGV